MPTVTNSLGQGTQSVLLTVAILESLARTHGPVGISELSREIGASKSRIFRHLQTLVSCGFIARHDATGGYEVGSRLLGFCRTVNQRYDLVNVALPVMSELRQRTGHTVIVSRVDTTGVHVLKSLSSDSPIVLEVRPGTVLPFDRSAQGKVVLAFMPPERRGEDTPLSASYDAFAAEHPDEIARIAQHGWAQAQMREGLLGKAAPVLDEGGALIATLGLLDTAASMRSDADKSDTRHLVKAARRLSAELAAASIRVS